MRKSRANAVERYIQAYEANKTNGKSWNETLREYGLNDSYPKLELEAVKNAGVRPRIVSDLISLVNRTTSAGRNQVFVEYCIKVAKRELEFARECLSVNATKEPSLFNAQELTDAQLIQELQARHIHLGTDGKWHKFQEVVVRKMEDSIIEL